MKKILMVLLMTALVAGFVFAEGPSNEASVTLSAEVSTTFGVDLDNGTTGFKNDASANLELIFGDEADVEETGDGVYGYIKIEDAKLSNGDGEVADFISPDAPDPEDQLLVFTTGDIVGKVVFGPAYVTLWDGGAPSAAVDEASAVYAARVDEYDPAAYYGTRTENLKYGDWYGGLDIPSTVLNESGGITLGYMFDDMFEAGFDLTSAYAWDRGLAADNTGTINDADANAYNLRPWISVTAVENLTIDASTFVTMGYDADQDMGFGANAEYEYALDETFSLVPVVGVDYLIPATGDDQYSVAGGMRLKWPGTYDDDGDNAIFEERTVFSGMTVGFDYYDDGTNADVNMNVSVWEDTEGGLIPSLGFALAYEMGSVLAEANPVAEPAMQLFVDYKIDNITPYAGMHYVFEAEDGGTVTQAEEMYLKAGVDIAGIVPMCDLGIYWDSNEMINGAGTNADKNGAVTTEFTISF